MQLFRAATEQRSNPADTPITTAANVIPLENWQQSENVSLKKTPTRTFLKKAIIIIAWLLMILNVLAVVGILDYQRQTTLSLKTIQITHSHLFRLGILVMGAFVLGIATSFCWKNKHIKIKNVIAVIVIILTVTLTYLFTMSDGKAINKNRIKRAIASVTFAKPPPAYDVVSGIIYIENNASAIIGSQVVREGQTLYGVKIVKIHKDKVEFERDGNKWTQRVHQNPAAFWE